MLMTMHQDKGNILVSPYFSLIPRPHSQVLTLKSWELAWGWGYLHLIQRSHYTIIIVIVYLYFDMYKSCIPITSITSEIGIMFIKLYSLLLVQFLNQIPISHCYFTQIQHATSLLPILILNFSNVT